MKVLIIIAHPREDSLVYSIKNEFEKGLKASGHQVNTLDLFKIGFDPVLRTEDEPQTYESVGFFTKEVHTEMERINQHDAVVFCFPLFWSNMPAIMKGYVDRVFNMGFAYGHDPSVPNTLKLNKVFWMATAFSTNERLIRRKYIEYINLYFDEFIAGFCGIDNSRVKLFTESRNKTMISEEHLPEAYREGLEFDRW